MRAKFMSVGLLLALTAVPGFAQLSPSAKWATESAAQYTVNANITYRTASNQQLKMDVYYRRGVTTPQPTLVYMHGGFWVAGAKETAIAGCCPGLRWAGTSSTSSTGWASPPIPRRSRLPRWTIVSAPCASSPRCRPITTSTRTRSS